jgi:hypothetical protein
MGSPVDLIESLFHTWPDVFEGNRRTTLALTVVRSIPRVASSGSVVQLYQRPVFISKNPDSIFSTGMW